MSHWLACHTTNLLSSNPSEYRAAIDHTGRADMETIIRRMVERSSTVTKADILAVLNEYHEVITSLLLDGYSITTPTANYRLSMKGGFTSLTDSFESDRHRLEVSVRAGRALRQTIQTQGQVHKLEAGKPRPNLADFANLNTHEHNSVVTPNGMAELVGNRLKFDPADPQQGIFFVNGTETRVEMVGQNSPGRLMFLIPSLESGQYSLEVRAAFGQEIRSGQLDTLLTV